MIVGFTGSGNMAAAIARGLAAGDEPPAMLFTDSGSGRASRLAAELGGDSRESNAELAAEAGLLILAVKPKALDSVAADLAAFSGPIVSVLGATPLATLREAFPSAPILRTMPNVAVEVRKGVICHAAEVADREQLGDALALLAELGSLYELSEELLDPATAIMGCSGAYLALACGALAEAGAEAGIEPGLARKMVAETAWGTGELLLTHEPRTLAKAIASPGGSTEAGIDALEAAGGPDAFKLAVVASLERMAGTR